MRIAPACVVAVLLIAPSLRAAVQSPRAANPERPSVATHAYVVAPGYAELEQGVRAQGVGDFRAATTGEFNLKLGLTRHAQLGLFGTGYARRARGAGVGDVGLALKLRSAVSPRAAVALVPAVTLPTGDSAAGLGAGRVLGALVAVWSGDVGGGVHADLNAGPIGVGAGAPQWLATASFSRAFGRVGLAAELFRVGPGAAGPRQAGLLGAVSWRVWEWGVADAGGVAGLGAGSADQLFVGVTTNLGRIFK